MNWLNLHISTLRCPEYIGSEPVQRATWINVLCYACEQENGGRIVGAKAWKDRQWQQTCGVTLAEVEAAVGKLLRWRGNDLMVWAYPREKEREIRAKREAGGRGGRKSGANRREASAPPNPQHATALPAKQNGSCASPAAVSTAESSPSTERKGREGKGIGKELEGEGEGASLRSRPLSLEQVLDFMREKKLPESDGEAVWLKWQGNGFRVNGKAMKDWRATILSWDRQGYLASQQTGQRRAVPVTAGAEERRLF